MEVIVYACELNFNLWLKLSGLPRGWTEGVPGSVNAAEFAELFPDHFNTVAILATS